VRDVHRALAVLLGHVDGILKHRHDRLAGAVERIAFILALLLLARRRCERNDLLGGALVHGSGLLIGIGDDPSSIASGDCKGKMTRNKCPACCPPATAAARRARIIPMRFQYSAGKTGCLRHPFRFFQWNVTQ
jgi:hypothetical protein